MKQSKLLRPLILVGGVLLQLHAQSFHLQGAPGGVDLSFDPGSTVDGAVYAMAVQPDGKVIIGGQFTSVRGLARTNLARLDSDGSGDPTFHPISIYNPIHALARQSDGKLLVGTMLKFTICDEEYGCFDYDESSVVRLNGDGDLDGSFIPAPAYHYNDPGHFESLVVQSDGKVLVSGNFTSINGTARNYVARLNANGTLDTGFDPGTGANGLVTCVAPQSDGKVIIGGHFTSFDGAIRHRIARLHANGSLDESFVPDAGIGGENPSWVDSVAVQTDGRVLLGGHFTNAYGNCVARLNANGTLDGSFNSGAGANGAVSAVAMQPDGKVLMAGGHFTSVNGTDRNGIARLNADGTLDFSFDPGAGISGYSSWALVLARQADGRVLVGGHFAKVAGVNRNSVARLNLDGSHDETFNPGQSLLRAPEMLVLQPDGKVLIGGPVVVGDPWWAPPGDALALVNGTNHYGRARINSDGGLDPTFVSDGYFDLRLDALLDPVDCPSDDRYGCSVGAVTTALLVQSDGKVVIGGYIETTITGEETFVQVYRSFFSRFNEDGSWESDFIHHTNTYVRTMAQQPDGKLVIGGSLLLNGISCTVARLFPDGRVDDSFQLGEGPASVASLALQSDGQIVVGAANLVARLNQDGSRQASFNAVLSPGATANSLAIQPDGKVLAGGSFTSVNGTSRNRIARLNENGSLDHSFDPGAGANGNIYSLALQSDGNIVIGGDFTTVNGVMRRYVARLFGNAAPPSCSIVRSNALIIIAWPASAKGFQLQQSTHLDSAHWSASSETVADDGTTRSIVVSAAPGRRFFRLYQE